MASPSFSPRLFGDTGLRVGPVGLGSSYGLSAKGVERAFDEGVRFFLWGSRRRDAFGQGLREVARTHREETVIAIQSYTRVGALMGWSVDRALKALGTDYVDVLGLAWWNGTVPRRIVDAALNLKARGKIRHLMISSHIRPAFEQYIDDLAFDALMLRYNAAHPGAEREIFPFLGPHLTRRRPATLAFTATRWGTLLNPAFMPAGTPVPRASDCYRFALTNENVDVCLAGPRDETELAEALAAVSRGPLDEDEMAWMRGVGASVRAATTRARRRSAMDVVDSIAAWNWCSPKQLPAR